MALALGKTLAELGQMPADELPQWQAFYRRHPFGLLRADLQAYLAGTQARTGFGGKGIKLKDAMEWCDFGGKLLTKRERRRRERLEEMALRRRPRFTSEKIRGWAAMFEAAEKGKECQASS